MNAFKTFSKAGSLILFFSIQIQPVKPNLRAAAPKSRNLLGRAKARLKKQTPINFHKKGLAPNQKTSLQQILGFRQPSLAVKTSGGLEQRSEFIMSSLGKMPMLFLSWLNINNVPLFFVAGQRRKLSKTRRSQIIFPSGEVTEKLKRR